MESDAFLLWYSSRRKEYWDNHSNELTVATATVAHVGRALPLYKGFLF